MYSRGSARNLTNSPNPKQQIADARVRAAHTAGGRLATLCVVLSGFLLLFLFLATGAGAATYTVDSAADTATPDTCSVAPTDCTLRGAITTANAQVGADVIDFDPSITEIEIDTSLPDVTEQLQIDGGGVVLKGSAAYGGSCTAGQYALTATAVPLVRIALPVAAVCGRAVASTVPAPTIQVGPRRADGGLSISGTAAAGTVEIYRADPPAGEGEASATYKDQIASNGAWSFTPSIEPVSGLKFAATVTSGGATSNFSTSARTPDDLTSPTLSNAVATNTNTIRMDFDEAISPAVAGLPGAFALSMGGLPRPVTSVSVNGNSVYLVSSGGFWRTGEAGTVGVTGNGRITDLAGNELIGLPGATVLAGPGELAGPLISNLRTKPRSFCQRKTRKCNRRTRTYIYFRLNKAARVVFTVRRAKGNRFVVRFKHKYEAGSIRTRLVGAINGRRLPATNLVVEVVAEDFAHNLSVPVVTPVRVVTRNARL